MLTMKDNMIHQQLLDTVSIYKILFEEGKKVQRISSYHYSSQFEQDEINNITRDIEISLMNGEKMSLSINKTTKAYDLCKEIASNKNITSWLDYKLFLINSEKDERLIHDDEFVYKIVESEMAEMLEQNVDYLVEVEFPKEDITLGMKPKSKSFVSSPQKKSFLSGMKDKMKDLYNNVRRKTKNIFGSEYIIVFKKYIYLYDNIEAVDYSLDVNKLNLLSEQILNEVYKLNYVLSFNDYAFFAALQFFLKKGKITLIQTTDFLHLMEENSLKEYVPKEVFEKKPKDFWINAVGSLWKKFSEEFEKTSLQNQLFNENNSSAVLKSLQVKKKPNLAILDKKPIDENLIARYVCINCIKKTPLYGNSCFWVGIENKPEGEKYPNSTWIAINCKNIRILDDRKGELKRIEYPSINKCNSFPTSVEIILESIKKDENNKNNEQIVKKYRFDAPNSFDIYQLIELYRYLGVVIKSNRSKYIEVVKNGDVVLKSKFMH